MDANICTTDDGEGCGERFVMKGLPGLCMLCSKLATLEPGSPEYEVWMNVRQCESCGRAYKNWKSERTICGACDTAKMPPPGSQQRNPEPNGAAQVRVQHALDVARQARGHALNARLTKNPAPAFAPGGPLASIPPPGSAGSEDMVFITVECRIMTSSKKDGKSTDMGLGLSGRLWPKESYLSEVIDEHLATVNANWTRTEPMELVKDEVQMRFAGNKVIAPEYENGTIGEIYEKYMTGDMGTFYGASEPKGRASGAKPQFRMHMELFIDKGGHEAEAQEAQVGRKRSNTQGGVSEVPQKRRAALGLGQPASMYMRSQLPANIGRTASESVILQKAVTAISEDTGEVSTMWPDDAQTVSGSIGRESCARGKTKAVHQLSIDGKLYMAKRFFTVSKEGEIVTGAENTYYLELELVRLKSLEWFLDLFKASASKKNIEYASNLVVTPAFLACEVGMSSSASDLGPAEEAVWLIEPRRTMSVTKYCGTMEYPRRSDKIGVTLSAFLHYVFWASQEEFVFSDIQGSRMNVRGVDTLILFDPMSHTVDADSGVGDHGSEGIETFKAQHRCSHICQLLGFKEFRVSTVSSKKPAAKNVDTEDENEAEVEEEEADNGDGDARPPQTDDEDE
ncbi:kinase-like domain-containing protein [Ephemerocybe angulata]|uniref:Kinase-like domain-containing protein n=1 Tax=Ephemerocybe angulata TaxID=980116 RepID=A0A8H6IJM7_9AGAR|nr:kinase-like domain-containing protein [Tulosesus angulatus]